MSAAAPVSSALPKKPAGKGPRLSDADLFAAIDLTRDELKPVRQALGAKDLPAARAALARYFRTRKPGRWWFDPYKVDRRTRYSKAAADNAVAGRVSVIRIPYEFPGGEIDWFYNPTVARKDLAVNYEWQWQLGRMSYWRDLGNAYWATGDEKYARAFVRQLRSWVANCPRPAAGSGNVANSAWRTIECGIRMTGPWPEALHRFLKSPSLTDDDICLYLKCSIEHALHLRKHHRSVGNWLTMEMAGLYTVGAVFPELKEATAWRKYAAEKLHDELSRQFTPDGAQIELTPGYHQVALRNILHIPALAERLGLTDELPKAFTARSEKAFDYNLYLMTPDRDLPKFNDSWSNDVPKTLRQAVGLFPKRADFQWVATDGRSGSAPTTISHAFEYAGYYVMRSSWRRDANYCVLDAGPLGAGHVHQDKLNVVLWAFGREVLYDGGGGNYEHSPYRRYAIDTFSHNTVLVDGQPQRRDRARGTPAKKLTDVRWKTTDAFDFAAGVYDDKYGDKRPAVHTRRVLFVRPDLLVVADTLTPKDKAEHTYQARWHLRTTATQTDKATRAVVTVDGGKPNLAVVPLLAEGLNLRAVSGQTKPELLGWYVHKWGNPPTEPTTTVLHERKGKGAQHLLTLLLPLRRGAKNPVAEVRRLSDTAAEVVLTNGRTLRIEASAEPNGPITFTETLPGDKPGRQVSAK